MITDKMERQQSPIYGHINIVFDFSCRNNVDSAADRKFYRLLDSIFVDNFGLFNYTVDKSILTPLRMYVIYNTNSKTNLVVSFGSYMLY